MYGAAQEENKIEFLTELASFCSKIKEPYIAGGDFNLIRFISEKNTATGVHGQTGVFNSIIASQELIDIYMTGGKFTWSNNQAVPTLKRLDRVLVSKEWEDLFPRILMYKLPRDVSDHNPLILTTRTKQHMEKLSFRFELSWIKHPDFLHNVKMIWEKPCFANSAVGKLQSKMKRFKQFFKGWGFNKLGEQRKKKTLIQEELMKLELIEEETFLSLSQMHKKMQLQSNFLKLLEEEELYWLKRSHERWLCEGDLNTKYFQRIANGRKRKNTI